MTNKEKNIEGLFVYRVVNLRRFFRLSSITYFGMAQTGKKLESWATEEDKKIYQEMKHADKVMRESAKKLGIKNPILEIPLEID